MAKGAKVEALSTLTMKLFEPGMSMMHRAGLGGLACSLKYIERAHKMGVLLDDDVPGGPWENGKPPWTIEPLQITLDFGEPENAKKFMQKLFLLSFQIKDDLIFLPGQYKDVPPTIDVRTELQNGLILSFLQHGQTRKLNKNEEIRSYEYDEKQIQYSFKACSSFKHQEEWEKLCDSKGRLKPKQIEVSGALNPGSVVRHNAFSGQTKIEDSVEQILPLYFAIIGCLALPINRGCGVLIVPEVSNLNTYSTFRPYMTPVSARECKIASASDAALQAQLRTVTQRIMEVHEISACHAFTFEPTPWASQQKSRVKRIDVPTGDENDLEYFEIALALLPPRIIHRTVEEKGKNKEKVEKTEYFWIDSVVRPLIADNLAQGKRWYEDFHKLMISHDPVSKKPLCEKILYEKKGLHAMTQKIPWQDRGESTIVESIHEAIRRRYAVIADENEGNPVARKKRWQGEYDKWRLAFSGAKTPEQFRFSLCDLWSRAGINQVLKEEWKDVLPMLDVNHWSLTRDLALLALASYSKKGVEEIEETEDANNSNE